MKITPYLFFDGTCREAMSFYQSAFGGDMEIVTYGQGMGAQAPAKLADRVMHARLHKGDFTLMASDSHPDLGDVRHGDTIELALTCESAHQLDDVFAKLSAGGAIEMPPGEAPWGGRFAKFKDKLGFSWMLNADQSA